MTYKLFSSLAEWCRVTYAASRSLTLLAVLLTIAAASLPSGFAWLVGSLPQGGAINGPLSTVAAILVVTALIYLLALVMPVVTDNLRDRVVAETRKRLMVFASEPAKIDHFETPSTMDRIRLLNRDAYRLAGIQHLLASVGAIVSVTVVGTLLVSLNAAYMVLILSALVPAVAGTIGDYRQGRIWLGNEGERRTADAASGVLLSPTHGLWVRSYGLQGPLKALVHRAADRQRHLQVRSRSKFMFAEFAGACLYVGLLLYFLAPLVSQVGDNPALVTNLSLLLLLSQQVLVATRTLAASGTAVLDGLQTYQEFVALRDFWKHEIADQTGPPAPLRLTHGITLESVSFKHNGASRDSLTAVSTTLAAGEVICVVGANGAGKSTLANLLAGFYAPTFGRIRADQVDVQSLSAMSWFDGVTAAFQDFSRLESTVGGAVAALHDYEDQTRVWAALDAAGAGDFVRTLPNDLETRIGNRLEGATNLSGGQWQRLALARCFYKSPARLILMDEPASALDPEAERSLYRNIVTSARTAALDSGTVSIIISHRLTTARLADRILVLNRGRLVEDGDHESLLALKGEYHRLFTLQASHYV